MPPPCRGLPLLLLLLVLAPNPLRRKPFSNLNLASKGVLALHQLDLEGPFATQTGIATRSSEPLASARLLSSLYQAGRSACSMQSALRGFATWLDYQAKLSLAPRKLFFSFLSYSAVIITENYLLGVLLHAPCDSLFGPRHTHASVL